MGRSAAVLAASAIAVLGAPELATAGVVSVVNTTSFTPVTVRAAAGEYNDLRVERSSVYRNLTYSDANVALTAGRGCDYYPTGEVQCPNPNATVEVFLGDRPDKARVIVSSGAFVHGGADDDTILADSFASHSEVYGEGGDDEITAGGEGGQIADGGPGDDDIRSGGFAGQAFAFGGSGNDLIRHRSALGGSGEIDGGTGDDAIVTQPLPGTITGGPGDDIIVVDGDEPQNRGSGSWTISAGDGNDSVVGGKFADTIDAGPGRDFVDSRGGGADTVRCGDGLDVARIDAGDTVDADCEVQLP